MVISQKTSKKHLLEPYIKRLNSGEALLVDSPENVLEVVGILHSYGIVLDAYSRNLIYIAEDQFLVFFPFFKYFNGDVSFQKLLQHWWHNRINFEYAEYCMKSMFWHGGGKLDAYLDTPKFEQQCAAAIQAKFKGNPFVQGLNGLFPNFLTEQARQMAYYSGLGLLRPQQGRRGGRRRAARIGWHHARRRHHRHPRSPHPRAHRRGVALDVGTLNVEMLTLVNARTSQRQTS